MSIDWAHLKTAVERALHSAEKGERGSMRVHCRAAEGLVRGHKEGHLKEIAEQVHHAQSSLDMGRAKEFLQKALELVGQSA
jgi:hypothetical protein